MLKFCKNSVSLCLLGLKCTATQETVCKNLSSRSIHSQIVKDMLNAGRIQIECRRNAGHSHWQNIKATKGAKDAEKNKITTEIARKIKVAIQEGQGQTDPKLNILLARVLEEGRAKDVPAATMNRAVERFTKAKESKGSQMFVEGRALGSCSFIVECFTDKQKWMRQSMSHIFKEYGGKLSDGGSCKHLFSHKGVIYVTPFISTGNTETKQSLSHDKALELAIEAGAEDVVEDVDELDEPIFKFLCDPKDLHQVREALKAVSITPRDARLEYIPDSCVTFDADNLSIAMDMIEDLQELEGVVAVYHNIESAEGEEE